jgi:hypothetical protein
MQSIHLQLKKLIGTNMKIVHFKNLPNKSPFAANWDFYIMEDMIIDKIDINMISNTILKKEKDIINKYKYVDDWGTGLGANSLTSRSDSFNLLKWPEMAALKFVIKDVYDQFLTSIGIVPEKTIYLQCWANVLRKGQIIKKHRHCDNVYTYLGGHICIKQQDTSTHYVHPYSNNVFSSKNEEGKITLFPNWIEHYTDTHQGDDERITIAFDINMKQAIDEAIEDSKKDHWITITN